MKKRVLNSKRPSDVGVREEADLSDHSHISASKNTYRQTENINNKNIRKSKKINCPF